MLEQERTLWALRTEIARRTSPDDVRTAVQRLDRRWRAIPYRLEPLRLDAVPSLPPPRSMEIGG
jgi:hypothetical protein